VKTVDQMNRSITLDKIPKRIVSIVPSQTELLYDLGLNEEVVGITKFCIHPKAWFRSKERVGGTKKLNIEKIRSLNPDLIIGNKEENSKEDIEKLYEIAPVWMSDIYDLKDAFDMISSVGEIVDRSVEANVLISEIQSNFQTFVKSEKQSSVLYFIWKKPYYLAGKNTFIDDMLSRCGLINLCLDERYPEYLAETKLSPAYVFLSSEPYPFSEKHFPELQELFPNSRIVIVDGEMFSWYGSRLKYAPAYFDGLLNEIKA